MKSKKLIDRWKDDKDSIIITKEAQKRATDKSDTQKKDKASKNK